MKKPDFDYYRKVVSTQNDPDILQCELKDLINESVAYIEKADGSKVPMPQHEWICLECRITGTYADLRSRLDSGVDAHCDVEVKNIENVECEGCKCENDCERDYRADNCYT